MTILPYECAVDVGRSDRLAGRIDAVGATRSEIGDLTALPEHGPTTGGSDDLAEVVDAECLSGAEVGEDIVLPEEGILQQATVVGPANDLREIVDAVRDAVGASQEGTEILRVAHGAVGRPRHPERGVCAQSGLDRTSH